MKEILFRGKCGGLNTWEYGSYLSDPRDDYIVSMNSETGAWKFAAVLPKTIGQFTGLTDKNGVRIFEGDVVSVHDALLRCDKKYHEFIGFVSFDRASFMIDGDDGMTHYRWADYDIEVIGSVYDNPELLEG